MTLNPTIGSSAPTFDARTAYRNDTQIFEHTCSHTVGSGSNRRLVVFVADDDGRTVTEVRWGGSGGTASAAPVAVASIAGVPVAEAAMPVGDSANAAMLRDLERAFDENEARWDAACTNERYDLEEIEECREICSAVIKQVAETPIESPEDAVIKLRVALKRGCDEDVPARFACCGDPDDLYVFAICRQALVYLEQSASTWTF